MNRQFNIVATGRGIVRALLAFGAVGTAGAGGSSALCTDSIAALWPAANCVMSGNTMLIGEDAGALQEASSLIKEAESNFQHNFGNPAPRTAVVFIELQSGSGRVSVPSDLHQKLRQEGWHVMPYFDLNASPSVKGALTHELGHIWLIATYQPESSANADGIGGSHRYGTEMPDWLDEVTAISSEPAKFSGYERKKAIEFLRAESSPFPALSQFLVSPTPLLAPGSFAEQFPMSLPIAGQLTIAMDTIEVDDDDPRVRAESGFYYQCRLFLDFLSEASSAPGVLQSIASGYQRGNDFGDWLRVQKFGLPKTIAKLESEWSDWLEVVRSAHHKPSGSKARPHTP